MGAAFETDKDQFGNWKQLVEMESFHILLGELRIHARQASADFEKTNYIFCFTSFVSFD